MMAQFVVQLGITPTEYRQLSIRERDEIVRELNRRNRR